MLSFHRFTDAQSYKCSQDISLDDIYPRQNCYVGSWGEACSYLLEKTSNSAHEGESKVNKTKIFPYDSVNAEDVQAGAVKTRVRWLITEQLGAPNFAMRVFEIEPNGYAPSTRIPGNTKSSF